MGAHLIDQGLARCVPDGTWPPQREQVEMPGVAILVEDASGGATLEAFTTERHWFGDNWFESARLAKQSANDDWGIGLAEWSSVPESVQDHVAYAVQAALNRSAV